MIHDKRGIWEILADAGIFLIMVLAIALIAGAIGLAIGMRIISW